MRVNTLPGYERIDLASSRDRLHALWAACYRRAAERPLPFPLEVRVQAMTQAVEAVLACPFQVY